ncbi:Regulator of G-protein signaling 20 [Tupaia chinensis]|uniref:Regulator of G-protein signaling 20 n=1 Tax=Tupaia chinensis TaxID=246437 RepID=L9LAP8_TUPCH|nr:Regulator of G-protein signaling 20 [Tupaia chinensis]
MAAALPVAEEQAKAWGGGGSGLPAEFTRSDSGRVKTLNPPAVSHAAPCVEHAARNFFSVKTEKGPNLTSAKCNYKENQVRMTELIGRPRLTWPTLSVGVLPYRHPGLLASCNQAVAYSCHPSVLSGGKPVSEKPWGNFLRCLQCSVGLLLSCERLPPMGSERVEMRKRQTPATPETPGSALGPLGTGNRGSNACCFCWCCCCSCSCPTPTLEEVSAWAQSFDKLMITPAGRNAFREFLRTEFSEENMLFWMACEELKKEANKNIIEEKARIIYEDYISILSPKEVSLDSGVREIINRNMLEPSQHIFDDAQLQIYTLMHRDSYPRFMNSALYKDLLQSLSEKSAEA